MARNACRLQLCLLGVPWYFIWRSGCISMPAAYAARTLVGCTVAACSTLASSAALKLLLWLHFYPVAALVAYLLAAEAARTLFEITVAALQQACADGNISFGAFAASLLAVEAACNLLRAPPRRLRACADTAASGAVLAAFLLLLQRRLARLCFICRAGGIRACCLRSSKRLLGVSLPQGSTLALRKTLQLPRWRHICSLQSQL